jgi:hypothetical protein
MSTVATTDRRIPAVIIHAGRSWYLSLVAHQAAEIYGRTVVVADRNHSLLPRAIEQISISTLNSAAADRFCENYIHMSTNPLAFELGCWLRWFYALELMELLGLEEMWHLDSDVLVYSSSEDLNNFRAAALADCGLSYLIPKDDSPLFWQASGHCSYWSKSALAEFCRTAESLYKHHEYRSLLVQRWQYCQAHNLAGGVSDMTGLFLFMQGHTSGIVNLAEVHNQSVVDHQVSSAANSVACEYAMDRDHKLVLRHGARMYLQKQATGEKIRCHALHFQGSRKRLLPDYYIGTNKLLQLSSKLAAISTTTRQTLAMSVKASIKRLTGR